MISTNRLVIVEGKYDKIKLERVLDAIILPTNGFSIFKDSQKRAFIFSYAKKHGIIILTDSDAAGFRIRNYIASFVPAEYILNAYIPDVFGKEKRKTFFSSEGKIGVEGMNEKILLQALFAAGIDENEVVESHTKSYDFYDLGLVGHQNSKQYRQNLIQKLGLPEHISKNNLLKYINRNFTREQFLKMIEEMRNENV